MKPFHRFLFCFMIICAGCGQVQKEIPPDFYFPLPDNPGEWIPSEVQNFYLQTVVEGLEIPWGMVFLPDGSMLVTERKGTIRMVRDGELLEEPVEGAPEVFVGNTSGLLDIALHPDYEKNGWIYITYSAVDEEENSHTALMRARLSDHRLVDREELFVASPMTYSASHSGSRIVFRENYIFFSTGDRGIPTRESAQDLSSHNGSIFRLYDNGSIPADNPFVGQEHAMPEIWSYGHRNPQGLAFHPETGALWSHEHGPVGGDELNVIEKGENYGWPLISIGDPDPGSTLTGDTSRSGMRSALYHWTPAIAPSGLAFVTSDLYPGWKHDMMISALRGNALIRLVLDGDRVVHEEWVLKEQGRLRNVQMGPDGFLYIANDTYGEISRLIPAGLMKTDSDPI